MNIVIDMINSSSCDPGLIFAFFHCFCTSARCGHIALIPLGSSRLDVSSPCILVVLSLLNSTAWHAHLDVLDTSNVSTWRDESIGLWAYPDTVELPTARLVGFWCCDRFVGQASANSQPTRSTQPSIPTGSKNEWQAMHLSRLESGYPDAVGLPTARADDQDGASSRH